MPFDVDLSSIRRSRRLYLITDGYKLRRSGLLVSRVREALRAGEGKIAFLQVREQGPEHPASDDELEELLMLLKPICREHGVRLLVSRNISLAAASGVDGVHLGRGSPTVDAAREQLWQGAIIGVSAHTVEEARGAVLAGADYVILCPVFPPIAPKSVPVKPLGVEAIRSLRRVTNGWIFALGGIDPSRALECIHAGSDGVATIGAVFGSSEPGKVVEEFVKNLAPVTSHSVSCGSFR